MHFKISENCPSTQTTLDRELCKTIVTTISEKLKEGRLVEEILLYVKEQLLPECHAEDLEQPIHQITKSICHAKGINEELMVENVQAYKIQTQVDAIILPLITSIELSSIQYGETIPLLTVEKGRVETEQAQWDYGEKNLLFEEGRAVKVSFQQDLVSNNDVPSFSPDKDRLAAYHTAENVQETKVALE